MENVKEIREWMIEVLNEPKRNYQLACLDEVGSFPPHYRPKLLLHVCCGPCSCYPLVFLNRYFDVTIYFNNSNIYPKEEFDHRESELERLLKNLEADEGVHVGLIVPPYDNEAYNRDLEPYAEEKERGARCKVCYQKRMAEAYDYADAHGFDYFTTVMTISRQKSSPILNAIGRVLEQQKPHKAKYLYSDFKKNDGILKGKAIRERYSLYNQDYCGCLYSYRDKLARESEDGEKP